MKNGIYVPISDDLTLCVMFILFVNIVPTQWTIVYFGNGINYAFNIVAIIYIVESYPFVLLELAVIVIFRFMPRLDDDALGISLERPAIKGKRLAYGRCALAEAKFEPAQLGVHAEPLLLCHSRQK